MADPIQYTAQDLDIATRTLWGEARGEPVEGQVGVAWVLRNRLSYAPSWWGDTIRDICRQPYQFSCWLASSGELSEMVDLPADDPFYVSISATAEMVFKGTLDDPSKGATQYQVVGTGAKWSKGLPIAAILGKQEFYVLGPEA